MNSQIDQRSIKVLLAVLDLEVGQLADQMAYDTGYVSNVLNGFTQASPGFRRAFGETIGSLLLGAWIPAVNDSFPAQPLVSFIEARAAEAVSKREFYRELGTSAQAIRSRKHFDGVFVDRVCCSLGVHPSAIYGRDYMETAS